MGQAEDSQDSTKIKKTSKYVRWKQQKQEEKQKQKQVQVHEETEPDYVFKTKRQLVEDLEYAPEAPVAEVVDQEGVLAMQKQDAQELDKKQKLIQARLERIERMQAQSQIREQEHQLEEEEEEEEDQDFYKGVEDYD